MKIWLLATILAQSLDITTTAVALNKGCVEQTYFSKRPLVIVAGKSAGVIGLSISLPLWNKKHPTSTKVLSGVIIGSGLTAGLINLSRIGECK